MLSCLVEQVPVILSPSTDIFFCFHEQGAVLCFHKVTLVVIFGCLVSRFCQPIDSLFTFSSVQFLIQFLCCSCSFNCYGSLSFSLCRFVNSMIFLCFRLLPLLEHPLFLGYCLLDCCIPIWMPNNSHLQGAIGPCPFSAGCCVDRSGFVRLIDINNISVFDVLTKLPGCVALRCTLQKRDYINASPEHRKLQIFVFPTFTVSANCPRFVS